MLMNPYRAPDIVVALGDCPHPVELVEPRADGQHATDAGRLRPRQHASLVVGEFGEIEVAVAIDQHDHPAMVLAGSAKRGNTPAGLGRTVPDTSSASNASKLRAAGAIAS